MSFLGLFHGMVDSFHFPRPYSADEAASSFTAGETISARIIFVDYGSKSIRLSLRPHVIEFRPPVTLPALGSVLSNLTVLQVSKSRGVVLALDQNSEEDIEELAEVTTAVTASGDDPTQRKRKKVLSAELIKKVRQQNEAVLGVFVHKSALGNKCIQSLEDEQPVEEAPRKKDKKEKKGGSHTLCSGDLMEKTYQLGSHMLARVSGHHLVEGWVLASNVDSYLRGAVIHSSNVQCGQVLQVEIVSIQDFGLVVTIGGRVRATCPAFHTADLSAVVGAAKLNKKFKVWK